MATISELVDRASAAHRALAVVAEEIEDEWQYIADLGAAWGAELRRVASTQSGAVAAPEVEQAIDWLIDEIGRVSDPHRAIDWLSTFPQAALLALEPQA